MVVPYLELMTNCPHCGVKFLPENINKNGTFKCSNCSNRTYIKSFPTVTAIIPNANKEGEILLTRRAYDPGKGLLDTPGGFVDYGEAPDEAIKRELNEELGVIIEIDKVLSVGKTEYTQNEITYPTVLICFLTSPVDINNIQLNKEENHEVVSVKLETILSGEIKLLWDPVVKSIAMYSESKRNFINS